LKLLKIRPPLESVNTYGTGHEKKAAPASKLGDMGHRARSALRAGLPIGWCVLERTQSSGSAKSDFCAFARRRRVGHRSGPENLLDDDERGIMGRPNATAKLKQISGNLYDAWGIGSSNRVFHSVNSGASWLEPNPETNLKQISAGEFMNVWGLASDGRVLKYNLGTWEEPSSTARLNQVSAMNNDGAWGLGDNNRIFVSLDGVTWSEPNPNAHLRQISAIDDLYAWGIGDSNRVFMTTNRGGTWSEPNPQARLKQVSAQ
jgi:hypothetical protein